MDGLEDTVGVLTVTVPVKPSASVMVSVPVAELVVSMVSVAAVALLTDSLTFVVPDTPLTLNSEPPPAHVVEVPASVRVMLPTCSSGTSEGDDEIAPEGAVNSHAPIVGVVPSRAV